MFNKSKLKKKKSWNIDHRKVNSTDKIFQERVYYFSGIFPINQHKFSCKYTQKSECTIIFVLFCKDGLNQKNSCHILTEPHGPTCQEAHVGSSHGLRDSGLVLGLQKPSLRWSSFSSHHTCLCFVPFPHVTRHYKNTIDHYSFSVLINTNTLQNDTMINVHYYDAVERQFLRKYSFHSSRDINCIRLATPNWPPKTQCDIHSF